MGVDTPHPLYKHNITAWKRCRDAYDGEDAVKAAGVAYLPKIDPTQTPQEYESYKTRAMYYEAVGRTVDGFVGAIARKPHAIELPEALRQFEADATAEGTGLPELIKRLCGEALLTGRAGLLVDFDDQEQRSYLAVYPVEAIINWAPELIVLQETVYEAKKDDRFAQVAIPQLRELRMEEGAYKVVLWRKSQTPVVQWSIYQEIIPTSRGRTLDEIPFFWLSTMGQTAAIQKPPLLGLVNVALSHYRNSADLEHGRHWTALPTLYVTGATSDDPIRVGSASAIVLTDPASKVGYAEFTGAGLGSIETALETKEHQMAMLGAMVLAGVKKGVEAAETTRIRTSGESSLLMGVVSAVAETLTSALEFAGKWMSAAGKVTLKLNSDFVDQQLDPQTLAGLVKAYQAGMLSLEQFLFQLQQADMLRPDTDIDDEAAELAAAQAKKDADAAKVAADAAAARVAATQGTARRAA